MKLMTNFPRIELSCLIIVLSALCGPVFADVYDDVMPYRYGAARTALAQIEAQVREASTAAPVRAVEAGLIRILRSNDATADAKAWACRTLRIAGSEQCVDALAPLLLVPALAPDAQYALRCLNTPKADQALRDALGKTAGLLKTGIIQVLGARKDRASISLIAPLASASDPVVAEAALYTLAQIGGIEALKAVQSAAVPTIHEDYREHALLLCAESMLPEDKGSAVGACRSLYDRSRNAVMKTAILRFLTANDPESAAPLLDEALRASTPVLRKAAAQCLATLANNRLLGQVLEGFNQWPAETQIGFLGAVSNRVALPVVRTSAKNSGDDLRAAALGALGRIGEAQDLAELLSCAAELQGPMQSAARQALQMIQAAGADELLVNAIETGSAGVAREALAVAIARGSPLALRTLLKIANEENAVSRVAALKGLGQLAGTAELPSLVNILVGCKNVQHRESAESALGAAVQRMSDKDAAAKALRARQNDAIPEARAALARLLAQVPCGRALEGLRSALNDSDPGVRAAALAGLAEWPDPTPLPDLLAAARAGGEGAPRATAVRGVIRLAALPGGEAEAKVKAIAEALAFASSAAEKKAALGALGEIGHRSGLELARTFLGDPTVEVEAAHAIVRLARKVQSKDPAVAAAAVREILEKCQSPAARQIGEKAGVVLGNMVNIAGRGVASSPDGLEKDGQSSGDQAAIDGDQATYWDEQDGAKLYQLLVTFAQPERVAALSIMGWAQHNFAPKEFEVLCDGKPVKKIQDGRYEENHLVVAIPETTCTTVELKITGWYGGSPAIRELGIFQPVAGATRASATVVEPGYRVLVYSKTLGFRHANIPLGVSAIRRLGSEHGFAVDATEESAVFTRTELARYKAVVLLSVTGDVLNGGQEKALQEFVLGGGGLVAIHGALFGPSACEDQWAWYGQVCCASFKNHSAVVPGRVEIEDKTNPSTAGLPEHWSRTDEWYNYSTSPRGCARVLATLDETTYQGGTMGADHPIAWCRAMGKGRFWYTAMGHTDESFREPLFLTHVLGGIEQAAGIKSAALEVNPKPTPR